MPRAKSVLVVSVCIALVLAESSLNINLAGHHNLPGKLLASGIQQSLRQSPATRVTIDISSSALGDEGLREVVMALQSPTSSTDRQVHLVTRMNQLTPNGVTALIDSLLKLNETLANATSDGEVTRIIALDLCWNHLHVDAPGHKKLQKAMEKLFADPVWCPTSLCLDRCGIGPALCRAVAKGLIRRFSTSDTKPPPLSLSLQGNEAIGDAGVAALAAAIRMIAVGDDHEETLRDDAVIFDRLDLSACAVGDIGVEALALALETCPGAIRELDISNNKITDAGVTSLARVIAACTPIDTDAGRLECLDLSHNMGVGDRGAAALAAVMASGRLPKLALRSCGLYADGPAAFGKCLRALAASTSDDTKLDLDIDLSGNPIGVLRGKKKDGGKYSASRLKSKASATAASYMNQGMNFLKKGLKDVGVDIAPMLGAQSSESDDEEEKSGDGMGGEFGNEDADPSKARCGAKSFANAFLGEAEHEANKLSFDKSSSARRRIHLGLRHCFFDHSAADALAAALVQAKDEMNVDLDVDVQLNHVLEDEMVHALHGEQDYDDRLREMAERYQEVLEVLRDARERATTAAAGVSARIKAEEQYEASMDMPYTEEAEEVWDSDAGKFVEEENRSISMLLFTPHRF